VDKRSCDCWLGVKSQSSSVIAGSCRNRPQSSLEGDGFEGIVTDLDVRGRNPSLPCLTQNFKASENFGNSGSG